MRVTLWPNNLGADVQCGRLRLELWEHGGVRRLLPDNSVTGYYGTHWTDVPRGTFEDMAAAAVESWKHNRKAWKECGPPAGAGVPEGRVRWTSRN